MKKVLVWLAGGGIAIGVLLIAANIVLTYMGLSASYNFGDPAKFEFRLISFWQIGAVLLGTGALAGLISRRLQ